MVGGQRSGRGPSGRDQLSTGGGRTVEHVLADVRDSFRARLEPIEAHHNRESATITDRLATAARGESDRVPREFIALALVAMRGVAVNNLVGASVGAQERVKELLVAAYGLASNHGS